MTRTSKALRRLCVPGLAAAMMVAGSPLLGLGVSPASAQAAPVIPTRVVPVDCPGNTSTTTTAYATNPAGTVAPGACQTQARVNTNKTVSFRFEDVNGVPAVGRTVQFALTGGSAVFAGSQPAGTQIQPGGAAASCTTGANGVCSVTVFETAPSTVVVTANDAAAGLTTNETIAYRAASVTPTRLALAAANSFVVAPEGLAFPVATPGRPQQLTYTVQDATGAAVAGQQLTLTLNRAAFFTPNCTPTTAGAPNRTAGVLNNPDFRRCSSTPAAAAGAAVGSLTSLGQSQSVATDQNGQFTVTVAEGRDAAFDDDGFVGVTLSVSGTDVPSFTNASGATASTIDFQSVAPLNGQSLSIESVDTTINPVLSTTTTNNVQNRTLTGATQQQVAAGLAQTSAPGFRTFVLRLRDQFGNLTASAAGAGIATGAAQDNLRLTKTGVGTLSRCAPGAAGFTVNNPCGVAGAVGSAGNPGTTDQVVNNLTGSFLNPTTRVGLVAGGGVGAGAPAPAAQERFQYSATNLNTQAAEQGLASLVARWLAPTSTFVFAGTSTLPTSIDQTSTTRVLTATANLDVYAPVASVAVRQSPDSANVASGTVINEQVTVSDQRGQPIVNSFVNFLRSGTSNDCTTSVVNGTGTNSTVQTNAQGQASFIFSCATPSQQNITAVAQDASGNEIARNQRTVTFGAFVAVTPSATPTASVSPSPSATQAGRLSISVSPATITPGVQSVVTVTGTPGTVIELQAYSRPNTTYSVVRRGIIGASGTIEFRVVPGTNTRLYAAVTGQTGNESPSVVINVRTALSLTVVRNGSRDYTFQGRILPRRAGQLITLYRVDQGREIITSQIKTDNTGTYYIRRVFTGSGVFGFLTRTGQTLTNAAGVSNNGQARPTAIYAGPQR